jgi:hypothetical protein
MGADGKHHPDPITDSAHPRQAAQSSDYRGQSITTRRADVPSFETILVFDEPGKTRVCDEVAIAKKDKVNSLVFEEPVARNNSDAGFYLKNPPLSCSLTAIENNVATGSGRSSSRNTSSRRSSSAAPGCGLTRVRPSTSTYSTRVALWRHRIPLREG